MEVPLTLTVILVATMSADGLGQLIPGLWGQVVGALTMSSCFLSEVVMAPIEDRDMRPRGTQLGRGAGSFAVVNCFDLIDAGRSPMASLSFNFCRAFNGFGADVVPDRD